MYKSNAKDLEDNLLLQFETSRHANNKCYVSHLRNSQPVVVSYTRLKMVGCKLRWEEGTIGISTTSHSIILPHLYSHCDRLKRVNHTNRAS